MKANVNVFYKEDIMKVIAETRKDWEEKKDGFAEISIDFYEGGKIEKDGVLFDGWLWCYVFDNGDYSSTDEEVFELLKEVAKEHQEIEIEE